MTKEHLQPHVRERLDRELDEKQKSQKQKQESHLYTEIRIATDATMKDSIDSGTPFDLVNFDKVFSFPTCPSKLLRTQFHPIKNLNLSI